MFYSLRRANVKFSIFHTITFALIIILVIGFADSFISNVSLNFDAFEDERSNRDQLRTHQSAGELKATSADDGRGYLVHPSHVARTEEKIVNVHLENMLKPEELELFKTSDLARRFDSRIRQFFGSNQCKVQIFMTWISPVAAFGEREFFGLESLFQTNPESCLIILSRSMDSKEGYKILKPLINRDFSVQAISPDMWDLLKNTPAEAWFIDIKNGNKDPGRIPLAQNLSNLIRLAAIYKYGGVYLDTDFIMLKDFSGLRNSIGAQSVDENGNWSRLNNAVLIFDKNHRLVYKFIEDFALNFDGSKWGHNGPYLVSRVVDRVKTTGDFNYTILPPKAFYPVDWIQIPGFFIRPNDTVGAEWVEAKIKELTGDTYGVHLWNKQSRRFKIADGSVIGRLISDHCVICSRQMSSSS